MIACPPSMIRMSACQPSTATRRWARTANQSGCRVRPKTWNARSATRDRLVPEPIAEIPLSRPAARLDPSVRRAPRPL